MTARHRFIRPIGMIVLGVALHSSTAFAQSQVRVVRDRVTIWRRDAPVILNECAVGIHADQAARAADENVAARRRAGQKIFERRAAIKGAVAQKTHTLSNSESDCFML